VSLNKIRKKRLLNFLGNVDWQGLFLALTFFIVSGIIISMAGITITAIIIIFLYILIYFIIKYIEEEGYDE